MAERLFLASLLDAQKQAMILSVLQNVLNGKKLGKSYCQMLNLIGEGKMSVIWNLVVRFYQASIDLIF